MYRELSKKLKEYSELKQFGTTHPIILLYGARRVGKSTLLRNTFPEAVYIDIESKEYNSDLDSGNLTNITSLLKKIKNDSNTFIFDEVQLLDNPGKLGKLIYDHLPEYRIIFSGSSSINLARNATESMAGRHYSFVLYPLSLKEKLIQEGKVQPENLNEQSDLPKKLTDSSQFRHEILEALTWGLYPSTGNNNEQRIEYLTTLLNTYLLKDLLYLNLIDNTKNFTDLLKLLAYQVGNIINYTDISGRLGISRPTVMRYIQLLKDFFIIYTLPTYRKLRRDEVGKSEKVYFYDLGIRNALIQDFSPAELRKDFGALFENFVINELLKKSEYNKLRYQFHYWRTKWGSEVDLVLAKDGKLNAYEIKTNKGNLTEAFKNTYSEAETNVITLNNVESLII